MIPPPTPPRLFGALIFANEHDDLDALLSDIHLLVASTYNNALERACAFRELRIQVGLVRDLLVSQSRRVSSEWGAPLDHVEIAFTRLKAGIDHILSSCWPSEGHLRWARCEIERIDSDLSFNCAA